MRGITFLISDKRGGHCPSRTHKAAPGASTVMTTRLLRARPAAESFDAIGSSAPRPWARKRSGLPASSRSSSTTEDARAS
jgi:hypothetical protein